MVWTGLLIKAGSTVATGVVGAAAYDGLRKALKAAPLREGAVVATSWGLRGTRKLEEGAENLRLNTADIVAEARERIGEEARPPSTGGAAHDHEH